MSLWLGKRAIFRSCSTCSGLQLHMSVVLWAWCLTSGVLACLGHSAKTSSHFHNPISQLLQPWWTWYVPTQTLLQGLLPQPVTLPMSPFLWHPSQQLPLLLHRRWAAAFCSEDPSQHPPWFTFTILVSVSLKPQHLFVKTVLFHG